MKVGIIGGGFGLSVQAPIINLHPKMEVSAVSTMNRHRLPEELLNWENPPNHYKNWAEMLEKEELDLLFVSSLPIFHFEMVKEALKKGINIVCEKPFTMNSNESKELLNLSKSCNAKVLIDFEWRYLPIRQKMKELIQKDSIGKIIHFEYHISSPQYQNLQSSKRGWMGEKQKFGGMLGALGTHMIDCLRWLVSDEIEIINGLLHTHVPEGAGEQRDADDAFFIHGKMKNNSTFSIQLMSGINHGFGSALKVFGSKGTITLTNDKQLCCGKINGQVEELKIQFKGNFPLHLSEEASTYYPAFYPFLEKAYDYMVFNKTDKDLPIIEDGHQNQIVIDKILDI
ncbi:Gfo/Idh/MocA family protein [Oceanobacillus bengalensis]|uniref:Gfo/Idh/MocA family oxidoreductase n=1 Tax=Oceanobacillus bengalensis TaxID=1435466 RepID=A0A494YR79_9BACI|nr:Gfo/Idh/MocA family oxidoreductase [Oceanobacillus bengalensis]RKQ11637.1 gfo/Idh/MocA family oxidoreductase [Oceanobacillus bengalensis]